MFSGHVGAALIAARISPKIRPGLLVFVSLFPDLMFWMLVVMGAEDIDFPADYLDSHQPVYSLPFSHGPIGILLIPLLIILVVRFFSADKLRIGSRMFFTVLLVSISHWLLDVLVHRNSHISDCHFICFDIWKNPNLTMFLESFIFTLGTLVFAQNRTWPPLKKWLYGLFSLFLLFSHIAFYYSASIPPSISAVALTSLGSIFVTCAVYDWLLKPINSPNIY